MRLFIAIKLPDVVREHLSGVTKALKAYWDRPEAQSWPPVSWTKEANLHLTLKFLGEVPDARVPEVAEALSTVPLPPAPMLLATHRLKAFPTRADVRVIVARVLGRVEELTSLHASIEERCAALGFPRENRPFRPHVTLGRPRAPLRGGWDTIQAVVEDQWPGPEFFAERFSLMQSQPNPDGPIYTTVATFPRS